MKSVTEAPPRRRGPIVAAIHHPDAMLDREASGELDAAEAEQLSKHLSSCTACRLEQAARRDFRESHPDLLLARPIEAPLAPAPDEPTRRPRPSLLCLALFTLLVSLVVGATLGTWLRPR